MEIHLRLQPKIAIHVLFSQDAIVTFGSSLIIHECLASRWADHTTILILQHGSKFSKAADMAWNSSSKLEPLQVALLLIHLQAGSASLLNDLLKVSIFLIAKRSFRPLALSNLTGHCQGP